MQLEWKRFFASSAPVVDRWFPLLKRSPRSHVTGDINLRIVPTQVNVLFEGFLDIEEQTHAAGAGSQRTRYQPTRSVARVRWVGAFATMGASSAVGDAIGSEAGRGDEGVWQN